MKLTSIQTSIIDQYTDDRLIDRERLVSYLEKHKTVKKDVFRYCSKETKSGFRSECGYCFYLDMEPMFTPVDRETFIRRIPFYFSQIQFPSGSMSGLSLILPKTSKKDKSDFDYQKFYEDLEWMFYELQIPLMTIFDYARDQVATPRSQKTNEKNSDYYSALADVLMRKGGIDKDTIFQQWRHYLHLCVEYGWDDLVPSRFITSYNEALIKSGQKPLIYYPIETYGRYFKDNRSLKCEGHFPCDKAGNPILEWTSIKVKNPATIKYDTEKSQCGELRIEYGPRTIIYVLDDPEDGDEPEWSQIYAGPQTMEFDHSALRELRKAAKMTQNELATAIGTSVRTYQKWENGETTPDGHYLIRLMNWLSVDDVQMLTKVIDFPEEEEEVQ